MEELHFCSPTSTMSLLEMPACIWKGQCFHPLAVIQLALVHAEGLILQQEPVILEQLHQKAQVSHSSASSETAMSELCLAACGSLALCCSSAPAAFFDLRSNTTSVGAAGLEVEEAGERALDRDVCAVWGQGHEPGSPQVTGKFPCFRNQLNIRPPVC